MSILLFAYSRKYLRIFNICICSSYGHSDHCRPFQFQSLQSFHSFAIKFESFAILNAFFFAFVIFAIFVLFGSVISPSRILKWIQWCDALVQTMIFYVWKRAHPNGSFFSLFIIVYFFFLVSLNFNVYCYVLCIRRDSFVFAVVSLHFFLYKMYRVCYKKVSSKKRGGGINWKAFKDYI